MFDDLLKLKIDENVSFVLMLAKRDPEELFENIDPEGLLTLKSEGAGYLV